MWSSILTHGLPLVLLPSISLPELFLEVSWMLDHIWYKATSSSATTSWRLQYTKPIDMASSRQDLPTQTEGERDVDVARVLFSDSMSFSSVYKSSKLLTALMFAITSSLSSLIVCTPTDALFCNLRWGRAIAVSINRQVTMHCRWSYRPSATKPLRKHCTARISVRTVSCIPV